MFRRVRNKILRYFLIFIYAVILLVCAIEINFLWLFGSSPTVKDIRMPALRIASELYTADQKLIGRFFREDRLPVSYDSLSVNVVNALVATEDTRFFRHHGVDFLAVFSGIWSTAQGDKRGGEHDYPTAGKKPVPYALQPFSRAARQNSRYPDGGDQIKRMDNRL